MTAKVPLLIREADRRMDSMLGGLRSTWPRRSWFAPVLRITGNVIRVCGQSLLGA